MARVLIAGCGYVGCALGARLVARNDLVWGLRRRPLSLPVGVEPVEADLAVSHTLRELPPALDFVVYAASPSGRDDAHYRTAYVEGMKRLLEALDQQKQRPRRIFFLSSTATYAQSKGEWVDEASPCEPTHFSGLRLLEAEGLLADSPFAATVLRLGGIYGPRRATLVERIRSGRGVYQKGAPRYLNRIHRDDVAGAIEHLMHGTLPGVLKSLYIGVDGEPAEDVVVLRWLAGVLGAPEPRAEPEAPDDGRRARTNKRCRNDRLRESGYPFLYPTFREGYTAILAGQK